jgi:succinate dehydrogenase / fumarate reductase iron-sulfur subunit
MRINGTEALACLTPVADVAHGGKPVRLEPLRNFPLLGDLLVESQHVAAGIEAVGLRIVRDADQLAAQLTEGSAQEQYENCIECGLCVSACPIAGSDPRFVGPAILAAGGRVVEERSASDAPVAMRKIGGEHGVWRCHGAFECSAVCPAEVDPAAMILGLRGSLLRRSIIGGLE